MTVKGAKENNLVMMIFNDGIRVVMLDGISNEG